jgi:hypothetical protein
MHYSNSSQQLQRLGLYASLSRMQVQEYLLRVGYSVHYKKMQEIDFAGCSTKLSGLIEWNTEAPGDRLA